MPYISIPNITDEDVIKLARGCKVCENEHLHGWDKRSKRVSAGLCETLSSFEILLSISVILPILQT